MLDSRRLPALIARTVLAAAALVALTAMLAAPDANSAVRKAIWGPLDLPNGKSAFPTYRDLGVDVLQLGLSWSDVARTKPERPTDPDDPAYNWPESIDRAIREGKRHGVEIALTVSFTPGWANGDRPPYVAPRRASDYAKFMRAASRRYRDIRLWMIWGEPTREGQFAPLPVNSPVGPRRYAKILDAAYVQLKRRSRRNVVIGANTFTVGHVSPRDMVRWMRLPNGKPPRLDWWGHNPFSARYPRLSQDPQVPHSRDLSDIDTLYSEVRRVYRRAGRRAPRLWLSEWTIQSDSASDQFQFYVSAKDQARWIRQAYRMVNRVDYVAGLGWYQLLDDENGRNWGLLHTDGSRKWSYTAYRNAP